MGDGLVLPGGVQQDKNKGMFLQVDPKENVPGTICPFTSSAWGSVIGVDQLGNPIAPTGITYAPCNKKCPVYDRVHEGCSVRAIAERLDRFAPAQVVTISSGGPAAASPDAESPAA